VTQALRYLSRLDGFLLALTGNVGASVGAVALFVSLLARGFCLQAALFSIHARLVRVGALNGLRLLGFLGFKASCFRDLPCFLRCGKVLFSLVALSVRLHALPVRFVALSCGL